MGGGGGGAVVKPIRWFVRWDYDFGGGVDRGCGFWLWFMESECKIRKCVSFHNKY